MKSARPQTVSLIVLAILCGLAMVVVAKKFLLVEHPTLAAVPPPADTENMLVWQTNLPGDSHVLDNNVATAPVPKAKKEEGIVYLYFPAQARGKVLKHAVSAATIVKLSDFYDPKEKLPTLSDILPSGRHVVTLRVDDPSFSPQMIQTGCFVDVTWTVDRPDTDTKLTTRLVHAIKVLSPPVTEGGVPNSVSTTRDGKVSILVAATTEQAGKLILAQQSGGQISVSLCSPKDAEASAFDQSTYQIDTNTLLNLPPPQRPDEPSPPERNVVAEYHGTRIVYTVYDEYGEPVSAIRY